MNPETIRTIVKEITGKQKESYYIVRAQTRREISIKFNNGKIENVTTGNENGIGIQAFTPNGVSGFASANVIDKMTAEQLALKASDLANENERIGSEGNRQIYCLSPHGQELPNQANYAFEHLTADQLQDATQQIHQRLQEIRLQDAHLSWQTRYFQVEDFWCIGRTDGTLVSFFVPRAVLSHQGTVKENEEAQSFSLHRSGVDVGVLLAEKTDGRLQQEAWDKALFIQKVNRGSLIPAGNYPLIIDHGLAKGLAHEAFGHAVEADLAEESVLCHEGKLKIGLTISGPGVDIIDGSLEGDWAYQPYSANGEKRETVSVVKAGILNQGLGDVFSADQAGIGRSGAGRAEYYGMVPLPRMTNMRLVVQPQIELPQSQTLEEEISALRTALAEQGLLASDHHYLLLGYRGGQVNIQTGDFVFQCDGAVNLANPELKVFKPGIFSGKILSVLKSVTHSIGEARYDAIGTCGKGGQMVPSSGGGSGYILLAKNENVRLGGSEHGR